MLESYGQTTLITGIDISQREWRVLPPTTLGRGESWERQYWAMETWPRRAHGETAFLWTSGLSRDPCEVICACTFWKQPYLECSLRGCLHCSSFLCPRAVDSCWFCLPNIHFNPFLVIAVKFLQAVGFPTYSLGFRSPWCVYENDLASVSIV